MRFSGWRMIVEDRTASKPESGRGEDCVDEEDKEEKGKKGA